MWCSWYIKRNLLNTGKYIYTDNVDNFNWRVKTERSGNYVLITYWSTEEILPYYIRGWYNTSTKKWNFYEYYNASAQELAETNVEVTTMKQSLSKIAWNDLGVVNTTATCNPENAEECGAAWYIKQNLLNEGNYKFKDNVDYFEYHVKTERSENNVFITYWSTEEVWPYYIRGWYNPTTKIWGFDEYNQLTYESIRRYLDKTTALDTSVNSINTEINSLKSNYNKMDDDIYNANVIDIYLQMQQLECDNVDDFFKIYLKPENFKGVVLSRLFYNSQNTNEAYLYQYIGGDDSNFYYIEYTNLTSNVTKYNHGYLSEPTATSITWNEWQTK